MPSAHHNGCNQHMHTNSNRRAREHFDHVFNPTNLEKNCCEVGSGTVLLDIASTCHIRLKFSVFIQNYRRTTSLANSSASVDRQPFSVFSLQQWQRLTQQQ